MLLGVVLHSATAYSTIDGVWWLKDPQTSKWMDALLLWIHAFRLPAFFVMAGFFGRFLWEKRGWAKWLENRSARLGLPLVLSMLFIYPVLKLSSVWVWFSQHGEEPWAGLWGWVQKGGLARTVEPAHFWFLLVLGWLCLGAAAASRWLERIPAKWAYRPLAWIVPSFATLLLMEFGVLDTPKGFLPNWNVNLAYAVFFTYGWVLHKGRGQLHRLSGASPIWIGLGVAAIALSFPAIDAQLAARGTRVWWAFLAVAGATAVAAWTTIYGLLGWFMRNADSGEPGWRYGSDSAYWVYLMHPPVLLVFQIPMMYVAWGVWVKWTAGFIAAAPILLWSYDALVRATWLGVVLNGRRYERGLPWPRRSSAAVARGATVPAAATD